FHVVPDSLDAALEHLESQGDSDILPPAFEISAIRHGWDWLKPFLVESDLDVWRTGALRQCLAPKQGLGLRLATQLDPLDALLTTAIVIQSGQKLEAARLPPEDAIVHSYRFDSGLPNGRLFRSDFSFTSFRDRSLELAKDAGFVLLTDISDFYPRVYIHRVENSLRAALQPTDDAARVLIKLFSQWNQSISYGLPVGMAAFRLIAEVTISDVDQALAAEGFQFCRYSDDFRIFTANESDARAALAFLAKTLAENHGLTLQAAKTEIVTAEEFLDRFSWSEQAQEMSSMQANLAALLNKMGLDSYDLPSFSRLPESLISELKEVNVWRLLEEQFGEEHPDLRTIRFALRQIAWSELPDEDCLILDHIAKIDSLFADAIWASTSNRHLEADEISALGTRLFALLKSPVFGHLEFFRAWVLSVFAEDPRWDHVQEVQAQHRLNADSFTRSAAALALGGSGADHWFRTRRSQLSLMDPWERRAFLAGAVCLPKDERKHWYASVGPGLNKLETAVVDWAKTNPIPLRSRVLPNVSERSASDLPAPSVEPPALDEFAPRQSGDTDIDIPF
nr:RNA-directed DNA polymerase [Pseudomonadota bacterium]